MTSTQLINATTRSLDNLLSAIGEIELSGNKRTLVDVLREFDPAIEDIVTISYEGVTQQCH